VLPINNHTEIANAAMGIVAPPGTMNQRWASGMVRRSTGNAALVDM
jgi:hypothetical protein